MNYIQKRCFCDCETFNLFQSKDIPYRIMLKCIKCKSEKKINTPEVSVKSYRLSNVVEKTN